MGQSMSIFPNVHLFESEHHLKRTWQARVLHLLRLNPEWPMWPSLANDSVRNGVYLSHHWFYITIRYNPINQLMPFQKGIVRKKNISSAKSVKLHLLVLVGGGIGVGGILTGACCLV